MTGPEAAKARDDAIRALTHRARDAGIAEPEVFAVEYVAVLMHQGWRPVPALEPATVDWRAPVQATPPNEAFTTARTAIANHAVCPVCGKRLVPRNDGMQRAHTDQARRSCPGSHQPTVDVEEPSDG
ncbi:MAG: hypothetical protein ACRDYU_03750 [Actinomycetes bacterium]